eukprot:754912-Hanusia_phi.AAC.1
MAGGRMRAMLAMQMAIWVRGAESFLLPSSPASSLRSFPPSALSLSRAPHTFRCLGNTRFALRRFSSAQEEHAVRMMDGGGAVETRKRMNLSGLKKETSRQVLRHFKRVAKLEERKARLEQDSSEEGKSTLEEVEIELDGMRERLRKLNKLEEMLAGLKDAKDPSMAAAEELAMSLEVGDTPPERPPRGPTKQKQKTETKSRLPYHTYTSADGIGRRRRCWACLTSCAEIRVGRAAKDNGEFEEAPLPLTVSSLPSSLHY